MTVNHAERAHALLSASGAHRWLKCTASPSMEKGIKDETSDYAREGTFAHELSELYFAHLYQGMTKRTFNSRLKKMKQNEFYNEEIQDLVDDYVSIVEEHVNDAKARADTPPTYMFEEKLDLSEYVPESFGTGDVIIYNAGVLEIIDLKAGKGIEVSAEDNPQLRLYALGALAIFDLVEDVEEVYMTIVQPRLNNVSTEAMKVEDLVKWGTEYVKPRAQIAWDGDGEFDAGDHCRFCKVKHTCRPRSEKYLGIAKKLTDPNLLKPDEVAEILFQADGLQKWAKDVQDYALDQAQKGQQFDGWKVVEGVSRRKYTDEDEILSVLKANEYEAGKVSETKLLPISKLEKAIGKKTVTELIGELVTKPPGKPTLVPESDKRPALGAESAMSEFDEIPTN
ncbi:DUF2800 domain-containing protein [Aureibacillus halotolerans]|uniref:Uncharacterized protein DUF2800 n=1 Tax=Aureibacillus halotolerans TaxID=1508390 RepID=A0A4R6U372_9BACI|nr:DUF2800 domain-containing protein [Aureibacillus halotolerans]TDQ39203.1 uncharacterized protein DUF2800 [Aureibacillus halotolerans]